MCVFLPEYSTVAYMIARRGRYDSYIQYSRVDNVDGWQYQLPNSARYL